MWPHKTGEKMKKRKELPTKEKKPPEEEFYFDPSQTFLSDKLLKKMIKEKEKNEKEKK